MEITLQIVSFNIPYPPDYGGVIDVFYKIKALSAAGCNIILHCFEYDRPRSTELEKYCTKVYYYKREKGLRFQLNIKPYIVITRTNRQLLSNLSSVNCPIIFEGLHTCYYLNNNLLKDHLKLVRTHNIEHEYYLNLSLSERNIIRKIFFRIEAWKLKRFELILNHASQLLCISPNDNYYFDLKYDKAIFIPAFHPFNEIKSQVGKGNYILFHGNLSVSENIQAVEFLLKNVLHKVAHPIVIAGKNPGAKLVKKIARFPQIQLVINPDNDQMEQIIRDSQLCLLPTFQDTGLKLKLLASLFSGRHCLVNTPMVHKTGLEHLCYIADKPSEIIILINQLMEKDFSANEIQKRKEILEDAFSNCCNANTIMNKLRNFISS